jgi:membrane protein implicated in regulation of membrane protease activity
MKILWRILAHFAASAAAIAITLVVLTGLGLISIVLNGDNGAEGSLADVAWKLSPLLFLGIACGLNYAVHRAFRRRSNKDA